MFPGDNDILLTLARLARGWKIEYPPPHPHLEFAHEPEPQETGPCSPCVPGLLLELEFRGRGEHMKRALVALRGNGFIHSTRRHLRLPTNADGCYRSLGGTEWRIRRASPDRQVPGIIDVLWVSKDDVLIETGSLMEHLGLTREGWVYANQLSLDSDRTAGAHDAGAVSAKHSPDFRSVRWFGTDYAFTTMQAPIVKVLWEAWERGTPDVGTDTLLVAVDASASRLVDIFRNNAAWGTLVVDGQTRGSKRLAEPSKS